MTKIWRKILVSCCIAAMLVTLQGMYVLADELQNEDVIISNAEDPAVSPDDSDVLTEDELSLSEELSADLPEDLVGAANQSAMWFMDDLRITQLPGEGTHYGTKNFDVIGVQNNNIKAPFDCSIVDIFTRYIEGNTVVIQSNSPVQYANGRIDYMSMAFAHDDDISDCYVGRVLTQGEVFYQTGTYGQVTGRHSHVTCMVGKYTDNARGFQKSGYTYNGSPTYSFANAITPTEALFISPLTNVVNSLGLVFNVINNPVTWASVSTDKNIVQIGENITFNLTSDYGIDYTIGIDDENGNRIDTHNTKMSYYTRSFSSAGKYSCYITAYDGSGLVDSSRIYFTVYDRKPQRASVCLDHRAYQVGEIADFIMDSDAATCYTIGIDDGNGNRIDTHDTGYYNNSYSRSFNTPGDYSCYVTAYNNYGYIDSARIYFTVYDRKPQRASVCLDHRAYQVGEIADFIMDSDTATCYTIGIDDGNGKRIDTHDTGLKTNIYSRSFNTPGNYSCYVTAYNNYGFIDSARIYFTVYDKKPQRASVSLNRNAYRVGEVVDFVMDSDTATCYTIGIDDGNGKRIDTHDTGLKTNIYSRSFNTPGNYSCYITAYNNYGLLDSDRVYFQIYIAALNSTNTSVTGITTRVYNGVAQTQNPTVKVDGKVLTNGTDYTLSYSNNTNVGTATVKIMGKGNYTGTVSKTFTINAASLAGATVTGIANRIYTGTAQTQSPTVELGEKTLASGTDYTLSYANNTNAGSATVTITGKNNYTGTITKTFTIAKAAPSLKFASTSLSKKTGDAAFTNALTKTTDGAVTFKSSNTAVATVNSASGKVTIKGAGTATITATAAEGTNYKSGSASYTLTVNASKTDISGCTVTLSATSYTYNGKARKPSVTVTNGSATLVTDTDYTVSYTNNTNTGTATVTITGKGNYTGTASKTFTINKAAAKLTFANTNVSKTTKDAAFTNALTKTTDGTVTFKSSNTGVATINNTSGLVTIKGAGTATITATASAGTNYKVGSASYTLTVTAPSPAGFSDVQDPSHPYYKAIYWAAEAGITKGYSDGTFGINRACTRSEAVMFLWRLAGKPAPVDALSSPFKDVPKSHAHYKAILWAAQKGITKGYSDGTFGINKTCTRGQIMTFIWRFKGQPAPKAAAKSPFSDVPKNHAYYKAILWGSQNKITNGFSDGTFGINKNCTRGQIVTFLYRAK